MARGWESKAVEGQIEQRGTRDAGHAARPALTPAERARRERVESLNLSLARTRAQLERATTRAHREMLERTLRALESEVRKLNSDNDAP